MSVESQETEGPFSAAENGAAKSRPLGQAVGRGFSWLSLSFLAGKLLSFVAQLLLGLWLTKDEFGVFAIATSVATLAKVFHDGGLAYLLVQRGPDEYPRLAGPGFWISITFSTVAGTILALAAPGASWVYGDQRLTPMLLIIALSLPLGAPAQIPRAKLRMNLQFRELTIIAIGSYALRHLGSIALAYLGFGAKSFVLPLLAVATFESIACYAATKEKLWREPFGLAIWSEMLKSSLWAVIALFFSTFLLYGDYLVLGFYLSKGVLGQYFFGYQLTVQIASLMSVNLQQVLLPVLSRLANDVARQASALIRTLRVLILVMSPLSLAIAVTIQPLESILWREKWAAAVPLMQIFAAATPLRLLDAVLYAVLMSRGRFRLVAWLTLIEGLALMSTAWLAYGLAGSNLTGLAAYISTGQVAFNLALGLALMRSWGIASRELFSAILPGWLIAIIAAIVTLWISPLAIDQSNRVLVIAFNLCLFSSLFMIAMRTCYSSHITELLSVIPRTIGEPLRRALRLAPQRWNAESP